MNHHKNNIVPCNYFFAEFSRSRSSGTSVIQTIRLKKLTPRVPPFKVTQGHRYTPPVTSY